MASNANIRHKPSLGILFSVTESRKCVLYLFPACVFSIAAGLLSPLATILLGLTFEALSNFANASSTTDPSVLASAKHDMISTIVRLSGLFFGIAAARVLFNMLGGMFFGLFGEWTVRNLRRQVFVSVISKPLAWFDLGLYKDTEKDEPSSTNCPPSSPLCGGLNSSQGLGGLMIRYTREFDDVRIATTTTLTQLVQNITTVLACLVIAFNVSYKLTFVILATVPLIVLVTIVIEKLSQPLIIKDRNLNYLAGTKLHRTLESISTVKVFNAEKFEINSFQELIASSRCAYNRMNFFLGSRIGIIQTLLLLMFVQGFWFGSFLISKGQINAGQVTQVFWAALEASSHLQACVPLLAFLEKGKVAMAAMLDLVYSDIPVIDPRKSFSSVESFSPTQSAFPLPSPTFSQKTCYSAENWPPAPPLLPLARSQRHSRPISDVVYKYFKKKPVPIIRPLRKIRPLTFSGEMALRNVTFRYPTRPYPHPPSLDNVSISIPPRQFTFIVGESGSGKSTIASLLLGLYKPEKGNVEADKQDIVWLDDNWLRAHVFAVSQGDAAIFEGTVRENVAIVTGESLHLDDRDSRRTINEVSQDEVKKACETVHAHDFIMNLPDGYDTYLSSEKGANFSGGQRQRISLARAWIRDPTVLILDEPTSALDPTSTSLVNEAIRTWRKGKTTIIITHSMSTVFPEDFVYVIKSGKIVENGFRENLEKVQGGFFQTMTNSEAKVRPSSLTTSTISGFDEYADYIQIFPPNSTESEPPVNLSSSFLDMGPPSTEDLTSWKESARRLSLWGNSLPLSRKSKGYSSSVLNLAQRNLSRSRSYRRMSKDIIFAIKSAAHSISPRRDDSVPSNNFEVIQIDDSKTFTEKPVTKKKKISYRRLSFDVYNNIPNKLLLYVGFLFCVAVGILPPAFSSLLARLIGGISTNATESQFLQLSLLMVLVAFLDGCSQFLKFSLMQCVASGWISSLRLKSFSRVIQQDKSFFDSPLNGVNRLVNSLVNDSLDALNLVGLIVGQIVSIITILLVGPIWSLIVGWQLSFIGFALAPVFVVATLFHAQLAVKLESENKIRRESLARHFHQAISNIKIVRAMSLENKFLQRMEPELDKAFKQDCKLATVHGLGFGIGTGLSFFAQGVLYYAGAKFMADGGYHLTQVLQVLTLIVFSISFAAEMLAFMPAFAKSVQATIDLNRLAVLDLDTSESKGALKFPINGHIKFDDVSFAYKQHSSEFIPERELALEGISFEIKARECVGIVGPSGSGKSTIAALMQRLYEPIRGKICLDGCEISQMDVHYLRQYIAVVSQNPSLFSGSISSNIRYGNEEASDLEVVSAAKVAYAHEFIMALPMGYDTDIGESASLISGGQAQRLAIARAILKDPLQRQILILDEATSALDSQNEAAIMNTLLEVKQDRTTLVVTHKPSMMKMCDRLIVVSNGRIVESGSYDELLHLGGFFAELMKGEEYASSK